MSIFSQSDYAYFYEDGRKMYHRDLGEVELKSERDWDSEAYDLLRDADIIPTDTVEPYVGIFVTNEGDVIDTQYRVKVVSCIV